MLSILNLTNTTKLILATFAFLAVFAFGSGRAHAATLNVTGGCTLPIAINSVNAGANQSGCTAVISPDSYGTNDTITIPAGTITLSADLPAITNKSVSIIGAGKGVTNIDANGHGGFNTDPDPGPSGARDHVFKDFTIFDAIPMAIGAQFSGTVTIDGVEVSNSVMGVYVRAIHTIVKDSKITDNINNNIFGGLITGDFGTDFAGLSIIPTPVQLSDIPSADIQDSVISGNSSESAGLYISTYYQVSGDNVDSIEVNVERTTIADNIAEKWGGVMIYEEGGTVSEVGTVFTMDAVTVSGNAVEVATAVPLADPFQSHPYVSGMIFNGALANNQNITNLTSANNIIVNELDDQLTGAGFVASLTADSADLTFTNATIVGNEVTQSDPGAFYQAFVSAGVNATFFVDKVAPFVPDITNGASAQNSLIAGNTRNGVTGSCIQGDKAAFGLSGAIDLAPVNLGNNITDDPHCTGYTVVSNILSTLGPLQNNGGPVETIALLNGSPAIASGGSVLGVTTDARGVARPGDCPSVGAFQFEGAVCGASTPSTSGSGNAGAPNTGANPVSLVGSLFASFAGLLTLGYVCTHKRA